MHACTCDHDHSPGSDTTGTNIYTATEATPWDDRNTVINNAIEAAFGSIAQVCIFDHYVM